LKYFELEEKGYKGFNARAGNKKSAECPGKRISAAYASNRKRKKEKGGKKVLAFGRYFISMETPWKDKRGKQRVY